MGKTDQQAILSAVSKTDPHFRFRIRHLPRLFTDKFICKNIDIFIDVRYRLWYHSFWKGDNTMQSVVSAINRTIPISQFNRGLAGQIFSEVKKTGPKVVMKNNEAEAVILPPAEYIELMDALNDYELLTLAMERLDHYDPARLVSEEEMDRALHITQEEMDRAGEVEFE